MNAPEKSVLLSDPDYQRAASAMKFRLTYEGQLLGASRTSTRAEHKHEIRMQFHPQLKTLWATHPFLKELGSLKYPNYATAVSGEVLKNPNWAQEKTYTEIVSENSQRCNRNWLPLVGENMGMSCGLDILFLRPGSRGNLLNVGDIDGRLKTIFDALAMPPDGSGLPPPESDQPIYVLLSDDKFVSQVSVETDELLQPTSPNAGQNDARLIITVDIRPMRANWFTVGFATS